MLDLQIITCSHRQVAAGTAACFEKLRLLTKLKYTWGIISGDALIGRCRCLAIHRYLQTDTPYMLFVDDDILFEPRDVEKIYDGLKAHDVIGGVYAVKGASQLASYPYGGTHKIPLSGEIEEVEYLSTGFMGISKKILLKMQKELNLPLLNKGEWSECRPFFESGAFTNRENPIYISEDWDFCEKVRKVGGKVYMDTSVCVGHLREQVYTVKDVYDTNLQAQMQRKIYGPINEEANRLKTVDADLAEFLRQPIKKVQKAMARKDNHASLFSLAVENQTPEYFQGKVGALVNLKGMKILDIGCGIGTLSFMLAGEGNEVTGYSEDKQLIDFCNFRKKKYNLGGEFTSEIPQLEQFNLICSVNGLDDNILKELGRSVKSGTKFYHFDPNTNLESAGFATWDGRWSVKK